MDRNSHLMYSEYMGANEAAYALDLLEGKKEKPSMIFTKSPVLSRVMELLPRLQESEEALKGSESNMNIEVIKEGDPFVEMNIVLVEEMDKDKSIDMYDKEESEDESNSEPSEIQNALASIMNELDPSIEVILNSDNQQKVSVSQITQESEITQEGQQNALASEITQEDQQKLSKSEIMQEDPQSQRFDSCGFVWRPWL